MQYVGRHMKYRIGNICKKQHYDSTQPPNILVFQDIYHNNNVIPKKEIDLHLLNPLMVCKLIKHLPQVLLLHLCPIVVSYTKLVAYKKKFGTFYDEEKQ